MPNSLALLELSRMTEDFPAHHRHTSERTIMIVSAIVSLLSFRVRAPRIAGARAYRLATTGYRSQASAPMPRSALLNRPFVLGVWLYRVRAERLDTWYSSSRRP